MTLQSAINDELPFLRAEAEARMGSRVTIRRDTGEVDRAPSTTLERPLWDTVDTEVPFRLDGSGSGDGGTRTVSIDGVDYQEATAVGHLPATRTDLADNDLLDLTTGEWAGTVWRVIKAVRADQKTARRVPIVEVGRPKEWDS